MYECGTTFFTHKAAQYFLLLTRLSYCSQVSQKECRRCRGNSPTKKKYIYVYILNTKERERLIKCEVDVIVEGCVEGRREGGGRWEVEGTDRIKEHHLSTEILQPAHKTSLSNTASAGSTTRAPSVEKCLLHSPLITIHQYICPQQLPILLQLAEMDLIFLELLHRCDTHSNLMLDFVLAIWSYLGLGQLCRGGEDKLFP